MINDNPQIPEHEKVLLCRTCLVQQHFEEKESIDSNGKKVVELFCIECKKLLTRFKEDANGHMKLDITVYGVKVY